MPFDDFPFDFVDFVADAASAAWAASRLGAACFAVWFVAVAGTSPSPLLASALFVNILLGGVISFCLGSILGLVVTLPTALIAGAFCLLLRSKTLRSVGALAVAGAAVGAIVWLTLTWKVSGGALMLGSWWAAILIGAPAGWAGGITFAKRTIRRETGLP